MGEAVLETKKVGRDGDGDILVFVPILGIYGCKGLMISGLCMGICDPPWSPLVRVCRRHGDSRGTGEVAHEGTKTRRFGGWGDRRV